MGLSDRVSVSKECWTGVVATFKSLWVVIKFLVRRLKCPPSVKMRIADDVWSNREPLEIRDPDSGNYTTRMDLPYESIDELDVEQQELVEFLHQQLRIALTQTIQQEIRSRITRIRNSFLPDFRGIRRARRSYF